MIAAVGGPRTLDTAKEVVATPKARVASLPAFFRDGFPCSLTARIAACHSVTPWARPGKRGRPRNPGAPHPALIDGQWGKPQKPGKRRTLQPPRRAWRRPRDTAGPGDEYGVVERVHLTWRPALAPLARKTSSGCKARERLRQRVVFFQAFYTVARPHLTWRQPLPPHERTRQGANASSLAGAYTSDGNRRDGSRLALS